MMLAIGIGLIAVAVGLAALCDTGDGGSHVPILLLTSSLIAVCGVVAVVAAGMGV